MVLIEPPVLVKHAEWFHEVYSNIESMYHREIEESKEKSCVDYSIDQTSGENGDARKQDAGGNIGRVLDLISNQEKYNLSPFQKLSLKEVIKCFAPMMCENPPVDKLREILARYNIPLLVNKLVFLLTKRRGGKTDLFTMVVAAILIVVRDAKMLYYSLFDLTCQVACETVEMWIRKWGYGHMIYKKNRFEITLEDEYGNRRHVQFINGQSPNVNNTYLFFYFFYYFFMYIHIRSAVARFHFPSLSLYFLYHLFKNPIQIHI